MATPTNRISPGLIGGLLLPFLGLLAFLNLKALGDGGAILIISVLMLVFAGIFMGSFYRKKKAVILEFRSATGQIKGNQRGPLVGVSEELNAAWARYRQGLILDEATGRYQATGPASGTFTFAEIVDSRINVAVYQGVANTLIGFGVFFTFAGLYFALRSAIAALAAGDSADEALNDLFQASATKFGSSIWALGLSIVIAMLEKAFHHDLKRELAFFCTEVDRVFPLFNFERALLDRLGGAGQAEMAATMQTAAYKLDAAATGMAQLSPDAIGQKVGEVMIPVFSEIRQELQALRAIKQENGQEILKALIEELKVGILLPMSDQIKESTQVSREVSDAVRTTNQAVSNLCVAVGDVARDLKQTTEVIERFQDKTLNELQEFATNLDDVVRKTMTENRQLLQQTAAAIDNALKQTIAGLGMQQVAFETSATKASAILEEGIGRTNTLLTDASNNVQTALERFRDEYQHNLTAYFAQQNHSLEDVLGRQRDGLQEVVNALQQTFSEEAAGRRELGQEIDRTTAKVKEAMVALVEAGNALGITSVQRVQQLQDIARENRASVIELSQHYDGLVQALKESLRVSQAHLQDNLQQLTDHQQKFYATADDAVARLAKELEGVATTLVTAAETKIQLSPVN